MSKETDLDYSPWIPTRNSLTCGSYLSFLVSSSPSTETASAARTWPYSLTRLGSILYIHRYETQSTVVQETYGTGTEPDKGKPKILHHL